MGYHYQKEIYGIDESLKYNVSYGLEYVVTDLLSDIYSSGIVVKCILVNSMFIIIL